MSHTPDVRTADDLLRQLVAGVGGGCPICRATLTPAALPRCPRCHRELMLGLSAPNYRLAPWLCLAIPVWLAAGTGVLMGTLLALQPHLILDNFPLLISSVYTVACLPLGAVVVLLRRRLRRCSHIVQWLLAVALGVPALVALVILAINIR